WAASDPRRKASSDSCMNSFWLHSSCSALSFEAQSSSLDALCTIDAWQDKRIERQYSPMHHAKTLASFKSQDGRTDTSISNSLFRSSTQCSPSSLQITVRKN